MAHAMDASTRAVEIICGLNAGIKREMLLIESAKPEDTTSYSKWIVVVSIQMGGTKIQKKVTLDANANDLLSIE